MNKNKKMWLGILAVVAIIFYFTPLGSNLFFGAPKSCEESKYSEDCYCGENEDKIPLERAFRLTQYMCENKVKTVDPDSETFTNDAISYAENVLNEKFPDCDMKTCDGGDGSYHVFSEYSIGEDLAQRTINVECSGDDSLFTFSKVRFDVDSDTIFMSFCNNYDDIATANGVEPIDVNLESPYDDLKNGFVMWKGSFDADCDVDSGVATIDIDYPDGNFEDWAINVLDWGFTNDENGRLRLNGVDSIATRIADHVWFPGTCEVTEAGVTGATVVCDTDCPHAVVKDLSFQVVAYYDSDYLSNLPHCVAQGRTYFPDDTVVGDGYRFVCMDDGIWLRTVDGVSTSNPIVPEEYIAQCSMTEFGYSTWYNPGEINSVGQVCQSNGEWI